jgi:hypothetical protein
MPQTATFTNVPNEEVEALAKEHKAMGAEKIEVTKQPDGLFSLTLTYPTLANTAYKKKG